ncbi:non-homologous end-joining DNA ligase [Streptomyces alkaliphilus]|uniref:non-homologous end-joining DNA ligase n=1 Tax=Streptomyces alkaliphilus TaxID=1472722 RepID=UPI00117F05E6|nr:non-homologous end-joining DNA ligase [Streptomyces alkaliphilus]MQS09367.1 ATP-dependent DNA ligase [Streptomyces alkaliphilus]
MTAGDGESDTSAGNARGSRDREHGENPASGEGGEQPGGGERIEREIAGRRVVSTHPDRVIHPATGTTKRDLWAYHEAVAEVMLPHLRDRPLSFLRYPRGAEEPVFFSKNVPPGTPEWVETCGVPRRDGPDVPQVVINDLPALLWAANLVAEFHVPQWRCPAPGMADRLVLDLDPGAPAGIGECCAVAVRLCERLAADGLTACAKTSGSKGLHLMAALRPTPAEEVTQYARRLAEETAGESPELVVSTMERSRRWGRVFIDWSQNAAAKTTAAPYTPRARREPTVSTPLTPEELAEGVEHPERLRFTISGIPARVERLGDPASVLSDPARAASLPGTRR